MHRYLTAADQKDNRWWTALLHRTHNEILFCIELENNHLSGQVSGQQSGWSTDQRPHKHIQTMQHKKLNKLARSVWKRVDYKLQGWWGKWGQVWRWAGIQVIGKKDWGHLVEGSRTAGLGSERRIVHRGKWAEAGDRDRARQSYIWQLCQIQSLHKHAS